MTYFEKLQPLAEWNEQPAEILESGEVVAVQPVLPNEDVDVTTVQPIQPGPMLAPDVSDRITINEMTYISENESALADDYWLEEFGSYVLEGTLLSTTQWQYSAGGFYDKMSLISDGLLVTDADQLVINAENEGYTENYSEWFGGGSHHYTDHHYYTAIDASNANGYVNYQGMTENYWTGETSLTGKSYDFANVFKGGDYGNSITGGYFHDTLIGGAGDDTFYSTGGDNIWTGLGGENTFVLTGGSSTITDFTFGSDTILIHKEAYVDGSVNFRANMEWVEGDDDWTLYNMTGGDAQALVILEKGDGFDGPVDVALLRPNGTIDTITFDTNDNFGIDLIA